MIATKTKPRTRPISQPHGNYSVRYWRGDHSPAIVVASNLTATQAEAIADEQMMLARNRDWYWADEFTAVVVASVEAA